jgi:glycosyltransferase involved in cell wall biosynthesis
MRVLMVTNNALADKIGGLERYVHELASALTRKGVGATIVAKRWSSDQPPREEGADGVIVERYAVPSKRNPLYAVLFPGYTTVGVRARSRVASADTVIHAHMSLPALPLALSRRRFLFTLHAPVWRELLNERQGSYLLPPVVQRPAVGMLRRAESFVAHRASGTVVLSDFMRSELAVLDNGAAERAVVLPGGVDDTRFRPGPERPAPHQDGAPILFTARRMVPRTGLDELIRAMPPIRASWPGAVLKLAGEGALERQLRGLARQLGVAEAVHFLGRISDQELVEWYRRASLVILPTRELEGFGLTTAEALACGAAVIGTPAGATPELLRPLDPALVTDDPSGEAIARAVNRLLAAPERLERIRERAASRVIPALAWDRVADRHLELYERLN